MWRLLSDTFAAFWKDECPRLAAALAFYTVFALPALLTFTVMVAAAIVDRNQVTAQLRNQLQTAMGQAEAAQLEAILAHAQQPGQGLLAGVIGTGILLVSATGMLQELQTALNRAWRVQPDPRQGYWAFFQKRLISLALLLGTAGLLIAALVASWALAEFGKWIDPHLTHGISSQVIWALSGLVSLALVTVLTAAIFKYMPDARLAWSDVWVGALMTALLFVVGKLALGLYFASSAPASPYGAAGALALVLLWIYYCAQVLLLGAEFTRVWACQRGKKIRPEAGAQRTNPLEDKQAGQSIGCA
jgi:membrane protein